MVHRFDDHRAEATCVLGILDLHPARGGSDGSSGGGRRKRKQPEEVHEDDSTTDGEGAEAEEDNTDVADLEAGYELQTFSGSLRGKIVAQPRGNVKHGKLSWNTIFVPEDSGKPNMTFGELRMVEHARFSHRCMRVQYIMIATFIHA